MSLNIITRNNNPYNTNVYIVYDTESSDASVIDPAYDGDGIYSESVKLGLNIKAILLTHGHFDHIGATDRLSQLTKADVYINPGDTELLTDSYKNASSVLGNENVICKSKVKAFENGEIISAGTLSFKAMYSPGHTKGSSCFFIEDCIFTGDTLFIHGYGRTDLYGGSSKELFRSLKEVLKFAGNKYIYPGHGISEKNIL